MLKTNLESIKKILENYRKELENKAFTYADMMADWSGTSESEVARYAGYYEVNRIERQRVEDAISDVTFAINHYQDAK